RLFLTTGCGCGSGRRNDQNSRSFDQFRSSPGSDTDSLARARPTVSIATELSATKTTSLSRQDRIRIFERLVICQNSVVGRAYAFDAAAARHLFWGEDPPLLVFSRIFEVTSGCSADISA